MTMTFDEYEYLRSVGGRPITRAGKWADGPEQAKEWNFGLLREGHPGSLELKADYAKEDAKHSKRIKNFRHTIHVNDDAEYIDLTKLWSHPDTVKALGGPFIGHGQRTGSCVGVGGGNVMTTIVLLEKLLKGEPEKIYLPFWGTNYGLSRLYLGDRGRGEGSTESTWARAAKEGGALNWAVEGLPAWHDEDGDMHIGSNNELAWSDGDSKPLIDYLDRSREHPIEGVFRCRNADDVWNAIGELKPCGQGSMYGYNVTETVDGEAYGKRGPRWSHKQGIHGRRIRNGKRWFLNVNTWKYQGYKKVWVPEADVDFMCADEMYAYWGLKGVPEDKLEWIDWDKLPV